MPSEAELKLITDLEQGHKILVMLDIREAKKRFERPLEPSLSKDRVDGVDRVLQMGGTFGVSGFADDVHILPVDDGGVGHS